MCVRERDIEIEGERELTLGHLPKNDSNFQIGKSLSENNERITKGFFVGKMTYTFESFYVAHQTPENRKTFSLY